MNIAVKATKHAAPGPYLGFALQPVRLCFHLLTCPKGAQVSLEYLDDIAIHEPDGTVTLEQTKSALKQNPLADWSEGLWKTIANWLDGMSAGAFRPNETAFRLYVTPRWDGELASALDKATTAAEIAPITATVEAKLAKAKKPTGCDAFLQRFLAATETERLAVISQFEVLSDDADPVDPIRDLLKAAFSSEIVDVLCKAGIGMAKEQADRLIRDGKPALIDGDSFKKTFRAFIQKINISGLLSPSGPPPPQSEIEALLTARPTFIRQLEIISANENERARAVSDFLRASSDKSAWAEQGLVFEGSYSDWDDDLVRHHGLISGEIADLHADKESVIRGRLVYRRCAQVQAPLEGRAVPGHFVHGCFNSLADGRRVGWHPEYQSLLGED
jgi:hypothetical protein